MASPYARFRSFLFPNWSEPRRAEIVSPARKRWDTVEICGHESRKDDTMGHTYASNLIHLVFSTKERKPILPEELFEKFHQYLVGIARNHKIEILASGGTLDHIHALICVPTTFSVADAARVLKANSSRWIGEHTVDFGWQEGYGAFSVSPSQIPIVKAYIARQAEHHRKRDSRAEFVELLQLCGVPFRPDEV